MFDKEANEYAEENKNIYGSDEYGYITDYNNIKKTFQKAAEFGYNKANEWHYVKDGALPKENQEVLIYFTLPDKSRTAIAISRFENNDFDVADLEDVIAWQEIILPKG